MNRQMCCRGRRSASQAGQVIHEANAPATMRTPSRGGGAARQIRAARLSTGRADGDNTHAYRVYFTSWPCLLSWGKVTNACRTDFLLNGDSGHRMRTAIAEASAGRMFGMRGFTLRGSQHSFFARAEAFSAIMINTTVELPKSARPITARYMSPLQ